MESTKFFAINLRRLREAAGLSQHKLAVKADVGLQTVFRAESKGKIPRGGNIVKLAKALEVAQADFFKDPHTTYQAAGERVGEMTREDLINTFRILSDNKKPYGPELKPAELKLLTLFRRASPGLANDILDSVGRMVTSEQRQPRRRTKART